MGKETRAILAGRGLERVATRPNQSTLRQSWRCGRCPGSKATSTPLPDLATRKMALDMLVLIRDGRVRGQPLDARIGTGDLSDCYKLYFDPDGSGKPRFRPVYRYTPTEVTAVALEAVAVGRRQLEH